jgi:mono/diheme cytochrome c family protein
MRHCLAAGLLAACLAWPVAARAEDPVLTLSVAPKTQEFGLAELSERSDAKVITIPVDVAYGRRMRFRAVPLLALLEPLDAGSVGTLEARARDGFVSQIPLSLIAKGASGGSVAWIAIEDPRGPWPLLPGKPESAGPFYLVWEHPDRSEVGKELWPYQLVALKAVTDPAERWPQMAVDESLPANAPARRGQEVFITQCMACHRMKGAGSSDIGPDLGAPISPVVYLSPDGLRALVRDPKAVRTWPGQQMPGFDAEALPDKDLEALVAYLTHMAAVSR